MASSSSNAGSPFTDELYLVAKDKSGSFELERILHNQNPAEIEHIFTELFNHFVELMTDPCGSFVARKLFLVSSAAQQKQILERIRQSEIFSRISCNVNGAWAFEKIIENLKSTQEHCIFFIEPAIANCNKLAMDKNGNRVLQKCLNHYHPIEHIRGLILEITSNALALSQDPFGNFVVQCVVELQLPWATTRILDQWEGHCTRLFMDKFGHWVVVKCLQFASDEDRTRLMKELVDNCNILAMDKSGNRVLQKCLNHYHPIEHIRGLILQITSNALALSQDPFGNFVVQCVVELQLPWATTRILDQWEGHCTTLSMDEFGHRVVVKCLQFASDEDRTRLLKELIDSPRLSCIMLSFYGKFVFQQAILKSQSEGAFRERLLATIRLYKHDLDKLSKDGKEFLLYQLRLHEEETTAISSVWDSQKQNYYTPKEGAILKE